MSLHICHAAMCKVHSKSRDIINYYMFDASVQDILCRCLAFDDFLHIFFFFFSDRQPSNKSNPINRDHHHPRSVLVLDEAAHHPAHTYHEAMLATEV